MYRIIIAPQAKDDLLTLQRSEPAAFRKAAALIEELKVHPRTGTGKPEPLRGNLAGLWSVRIDEKNRMVFRISGDTIEIVECGSHYGDK